MKFHSNYSANFECVRENIQNIFWEAELTWPLYLCAHVFIYEFVPPLENSHSELYRRIAIIITMITKFLLCVRSDNSKDKLHHHYNDHSSYEFSLVCNRSKSIMILQFCYSYRTQHLWTNSSCAQTTTRWCWITTNQTLSQRNQLQMTL